MSRVKKKRGVKSCQEDIANLLEDLDTVYEKSKEIPSKLLGKHAEKKISSVPEDMIFNKAPKNIETEISYTRLQTFKVSELVGFDRITPTDLFNANRFNHELIDKYEMPLKFTSDDINTARNFSNITYTPNKEITKKMNLMDTGKAVLKTGNTIVNIAQFGMWVDEVIEDFKGDTSKDNLHIANDVLSIVPYLGQIMNIGVDIKDDNFF